MLHHEFQNQLKLGCWYLAQLHICLKKARISYNSNNMLFRNNLEKLLNHSNEILQEQKTGDFISLIGGEKTYGFPVCFISVKIEQIN